MIQLPTKKDVIKSLGDSLTVMIHPIRLSDNSTCSVCRSAPDKYGIFLGSARLSDIIGTYCPLHLGDGLEEAFKVRLRHFEKGTAEIENHFKKQGESNEEKQTN